ncbi:hypothetical protein OG372_26610 [Streptomyces sp. NBC_01020]|uniref:hypothetical protein n=1 Tax=unclassified Streptomyces TaxID=2593676 RepID=UPI00324B166A|nr:hypothetical protein OG372_26610 [Streptomyces sp. NBC_01020]
MFLTLVVFASACSGGRDEPNSAEGKKLASDSQRSVTESYWKLYDSIGDTATRSPAQGYFKRCDGDRDDSLIYIIESVLDPKVKSPEKMSREHFTDAVANRLAHIDWHFKASGGTRSASKDGISVEMLPSTINDRTVAFHVQSKCIDLGAVAKEIESNSSRVTVRRNAQ